MSVVEAKPPEGKDIAGGEIDAVLDYVAFFGGGDLFSAFGPSLNSVEEVVEGDGGGGEGL